MRASKLSRLLSYSLRAHDKSPTSPAKAFRKWDGKTPYGAHPVWCTLTILAETSLPASLRERGAEILSYHDILEDTKAQLPKGTSRAVSRGVKGMTFAGFDEEMRLVWLRSKETRLLKLYDKVSNLLDGAWMSAEKRRAYNRHTLRLARDVERNYGRLNIVKIARAICR